MPSVPYRRVVHLHGRAQPRVHRREEVHPRAGAVRVPCAAGWDARFVVTCHHHRRTVIALVRIVVYSSRARSAPSRPPRVSKRRGPEGVADPVASGGGAGYSLPLELCVVAKKELGWGGGKGVFFIVVCCHRCGLAWRVHRVNSGRSSSSPTEMEEGQERLSGDSARETFKGNDGRP